MRNDHVTGYPLTRPAKVPPGNSTGIPISFLITSDADGAAKYNAKSFKKSSGDVDPSTDLAEDDLGTIATSEDSLVLNLAELGVSNTGHDVTATTNTSQFAIYGTGWLAQINSDGTKIIHTYMPWAGCS